MSLPTHRTSDGSWICQKESITRQYKFIRRIIKLKFDQMDFQFALWQMFFLLTRPSKVYKNFLYRKHTKNHWARDDPAFLVLLALFLGLSSVLFAVILKLSVGGFFKFLLWVVFIDCIAVGVLIAGICWYITNKYLRLHSHIDHNVEFGYSFDVHCNAFFPLLVILHVIQPILWHVIVDGESRVSTALGNALWLIAIAAYIYVSFLGYAALPFLRGTERFLYLIVLLVLTYCLSIAVNANWGKHLINFYRLRIGE